MIGCISLTAWCFHVSSSRSQRWLLLLAGWEVDVHGYSFFAWSLHDFPFNFAAWELLIGYAICLHALVSLFLVSAWMSCCHLLLLVLLMCSSWNWLGCLYLGKDGLLRLCMHEWMGMLYMHEWLVFVSSWMAKYYLDFLHGFSFVLFGLVALGFSLWASASSFSC